MHRGGSGGGGGGGGGTCTTNNGVTISQLNTGASQAFDINGPTTRVAQAFVTGNVTKVSQIELNMCAATLGPASVTLDLYSGGATPEMSTSLGSATNTLIAVCPAAWYAFTLSNIALGTGITYYAVFTHNNDGTTGVFASTSAFDLYAGGNYWSRGAGAGSWTEAPNETAFRITTCD